MQFQTELRRNEDSFDEKDMLDGCVAGQPKVTEEFFLFNLEAGAPSMN